MPEDENKSPEMPHEPWPEPDKDNSQWITRSADPDITKIVKGD
jgi:hypothetical protein